MEVVRQLLLDHLLLLCGIPVLEYSYKWRKYADQNGVLLKKRKMNSYYIGVDVGTASVRAGLVNVDGIVVKNSSRPIEIWQYDGHLYEQSSDDIWEKLCEVLKDVTSNIPNKSLIHGIGFDATCSLVALGSEGQPVSVSRTGNPNRNIIMWLDHRATKQAERINRTNHKVLQYVGGVLSPEMQAAKLLWTKENLPVNWDSVSVFFDLPEYFTFKATGCSTRSTCSLVCKFNYLGHETQRCPGSESGWDDSYWQEIGLQELPANRYSKLGTKTCTPGSPIGNGLTKKAAEQMGLWEGCPVGCSLIDAHAGGIGVVGADVTGSGLPCENQPVTSRLVLVCGTSTCHMAMSEKPVFVKGVWGPYFSAMVPGLWLNEGGQSATGKLIDHVIETHPAYNKLNELVEQKKTSRYDGLNDLVQKVTDECGLDNPAFLTRDYHVMPDFHGNRSPIADPNLTGMICGLTLSSDLANLAVLYVSTLQALAHSTRHIIDSMNKAGHHVNTLFLCGGLAKNPLFVQTHADVTGMPCVLPRESESVLIGAAILGACACGDYDTVQDAMKAMNSIGQIVMPNRKVGNYHDKKYKIYHKMIKDQLEYRQIMQET